jgi:hypothetical protein
MNSRNPSIPARIVEDVALIPISLLQKAKNGNVIFPSDASGLSGVAQIEHPGKISRWTNCPAGQKEAFAAAA